MIFELLNPGAFWALWGILLVFVLLLVQLVRRELEVPSGILWRAVARRAPKRGAPPIRWPWPIFLLQVAALILIVLALAGPRFAAPKSSGGKLVVVLDNGLTMGTVEGGKTRLARARARAREWAGDSPLLVIKTTPPGLAPGLAHLEPAHQRGDLETALGLGLDLARREQAPILVLTDKPLPSGAKTQGLALRAEPVGKDSRNLAVVAFAAQPHPHREDLLLLYAAVRNYAPQARQVKVHLSAAARPDHPQWQPATGGELLHLPAGGRASWSAQLPLGEARTLRFALEHPDDGLAADDAAILARSGPLRVLLAGEVSAPLADAFQALKELHLLKEVRRAADRNLFGEKLTPRDFVVAVNAVPPLEFPGPAWYVDPPPEHRLGPLDIKQAGGEKGAVISGMFCPGIEEPLFRGFTETSSWSARVTRRAAAVGPLEALLVTGEAESERQILCARWREGGQYRYYLGFRPQDCTWSAYSSWPVFVARVVEEIGRGNFRSLPPEALGPQARAPSLALGADGEPAAVSILNEEASDNTPRGEALSLSGGHGGVGWAAPRRWDLIWLPALLALGIVALEWAASLRGRLGG